MTMKDYRTIVVGTDGSALAEPTVGRAAWLAKHDDADLVIVCAYSTLSRRDEAKNVATLGGDSRTGQVLGRTAAGQALSAAVQVAAAGVQVGAGLGVGQFIFNRHGYHPGFSSANRPRKRSCAASSRLCTVRSLISKISAISPRRSSW